MQNILQGSLVIISVAGCIPWMRYFDCQRYFTQLDVSHDSQSELTGYASFVFGSANVSVNLRSYDKYLFKTTTQLGLVEDESKPDAQTLLGIQLWYINQDIGLEWVQITDIPIKLSNNFQNKWTQFTFTILQDQLTTNSEYYIHHQCRFCVQVYAITYYAAGNDQVQSIIYFYLLIKRDRKSGATIETLFRILIKTSIVESTSNDFRQTQIAIELIECHYIYPYPYPYHDNQPHLNDQFILQFGNYSALITDSSQQPFFYFWQLDCQLEIYHFIKYYLCVGATSKPQFDQIFSVLFNCIFVIMMIFLK